MKKIISNVILLLILSPVWSQPTITQKLDELLSAYTAGFRFNGTALVSLHGQILLEKGYGLKNYRTKIPNDANTIYQIASVTKEFTSTLILKLAELKKLSLTDRLSHFFPGFPKGDSISIEQLLGHTSGINDLIFPDPDKPLPTVMEIGERLNKAALEFAPGSRFMYSNYGYHLLGFIIQRVTGMSYYDAVKNYIFRPLQMNHSGFDFTHPASPNLAQGYYSMSDSSASEAPVIDSSASFAAGSIYSNAGDLYKWLRGVNDLKVIGKQWLDKATTAGVNPHNGYGRTIDSLFNKKVISHGGDIWGFSSLIATIPEDGVSIVLLSNNEDAGDIHFILKKIVAVLYNQPYLLPAKNEINPGTEVLQKYAGGYEMQPGMVIELSLENGHLMATTDRKQELFAKSSNLFILEAGDTQLEIAFAEEKDGRISSLSFLKNGQQIICKKIH